MVSSIHEKSQTLVIKETINIQFISFSMNEINRKLKNLLSPTPPLTTKFNLWISI